MANETYDLVVIGGGPAGYAAAIRAGQMGKKVACIELERAGGTCLNWGCIPSKALLKAAETFESIKHASDFGIEVGQPTVDFSKVMGRSRSVSDQMAKGIEFLFKKNKVEYVLGRAHVSAPGIVEVVEGMDKGKFFSTKNILIATGCKARRLPDLAVDGERIMTSREALVMKKQPESIAIIGAGAIGVEFAYFLSTLGTKVTLIEMLDRIVPVEDEEISAALHRAFKKQGIEVRAGTKVEGIEPGKKSVKMKLLKGEKSEDLEVGSVLLSIGVVPNLDGVLSPRVKPELDRGYLKVDDNYQTTVKGIYAAGDIIGPPWLAHVATYEAVQAVNGIFGHGKPQRVKDFPGCTYCHPQIASVGLTEAKAKEAG
ncbi:MAG: dihydrolipoyl dehydrogenase, partial [Opitutales bacterium]